MSTNLSYEAALDLAETGKAVRRFAWRRWLMLSPRSFTHVEIVPATATDAEQIQNALSASASGGSPDLAGFRLTKADMDASDWTDESWDTTVPPPLWPAVAPAAPVTCSCTDGTTVTPPPPSTPPPTIIYPPIPGTHGAPSRVVPFTPPAGSPAVVTVSFDTDLVPGGDACLIPSQYAGSPTTTVYMTVNIAGGPAGVFGLHIQLGSDTKPAESGYAGYNRTFPFTATVNPGGSLTPNVIYHPTGGDITAATPLFHFPPACPPKMAFVGLTGAGGYPAVEESGALANGDTVTLSSAYKFGDELTWTPQNLTSAQLADLTVAINGGAPIAWAAIASGGGGWTLLNDGDGSFGPALAIGDNTLVLATDYYSATLNLNVTNA